MKERDTLAALPVSTADGEFIAGYTEKGLAFLNFPNSKRERPASKVESPQVRRWHELTTTALKRTLAGEDAGQLPPLDDSSGTNFQRSVWRAMRKIPSGHTSSYGEVAKAIGKPKAVRAVGGACGANPIPVLVPCHRVLAAHQKIGGFSGGLDWKRKLLAREGAVLL